MKLILHGQEVRDLRFVSGRKSIIAAYLDAQADGVLFTSQELAVATGQDFSNITWLKAGLSDYYEQLGFRKPIWGNRRSIVEIRRRKKLG